MWSVARLQGHFQITQMAVAGRLAILRRNLCPVSALAVRRRLANETLKHGVGAEGYNCAAEAVVRGGTSHFRLRQRHALVPLIVRPWQLDFALQRRACMQPLLRSAL